MKLISIAVVRVDKDDSKEKDGDKATILINATDTSGVWVGKGSMKEMAIFIVREISSRIETLTMKSLEYKGNICHAFKQANGLCVCALTDDKYPPRAAHGLIKSVLKDFQSCKKENEWKNAGDFEIKWAKLQQILANYQDPPSYDIIISYPLRLCANSNHHQYNHFIQRIKSRKFNQR